MVGQQKHAWDNLEPTDEPTGAKKTTAEAEAEEPPRNFTSKQLLYFDGGKEETRVNQGKDKPVYLSVDGIVFDVSDGGREFFGRGGPYESYAGHECGVALANKMSLDAKYLDDFVGLQSLSPEEKAELDNWIDRFQDYRRYPIKGKLISGDHLRVLSDRVLATEDLTCHTGSQGEEIPEGYAAIPIYVGVGDKVFDCSFGGASFYGPGCSYNRFAGKDVSRALAMMSFKPEDVESTDISDLSEKQIKVLQDWVTTFEEKKGYPVVGRLGKGIKI